MMLLAEDVSESEGYGTFKDRQDDVLELEPAEEDELLESHRPQRRVGRLQLVCAALAVCLLTGIIAITHSAKKEAHWNSDVESEFVTPPTESSTTHSVYIYRGHNRNVGISYGMERPRKEADAWAEFNDSLPTIGWSQLRVKTAELKPHEYENRALAHRRRKEIMFAAGFAEGLLTHRRIDEHFFNVYHTFFTSKNTTDNQTVAALHEFFEKNLLWIEEQIKVHENATETSPEIDYWETVGSVLAQFEGLYAGYRRATQTTRPISALDLYLLNHDGDLEDLIPVVQHGLEKPEISSDPTTPFVNFVKSLKCSALVRILPNASDLAWGHATWDSYSSMNRIFKHYEVPYFNREGDNTTTKRKISMSSSPGYLSSVDDWYMTDAELGVMETTHGLYDSSLYDQITPQTLPSWLRSKVANFMAVDGPSWATIFSKYNSGTYNNQWMIVDTKKFVVGEGFQENGLTILEQVPGFVQLEDVSSVANVQGYWASYNVPYFKAIYDRAGFPQEHPLDNTTWHEECPRAKIFKRDAPTVQSLDDLKRLMRSNNWRDDPLSQCHSARAIAARYDLETDPSEFSLDGAIDAKVTTLDKFMRLECDAVAGPTQQNNPVFEWTSSFDALLPHRGHPPRFDFAFETMRP